MLDLLETRSETLPSDLRLPTLPVWPEREREVVDVRLGVAKDEGGTVDNGSADGYSDGNCDGGGKDDGGADWDEGGKDDAGADGDDGGKDDGGKCDVVADGDEGGTEDGGKDNAGASGNIDDDRDIGGRDDVGKCVAGFWNSDDDEDKISCVEMNERESAVDSSGVEKVPADVVRKRSCNFNCKKYQYRRCHSKHGKRRQLTLCHENLNGHALMRGE